MLSWFFKKWKAPAAPLAAPVTPAAVQAQAQQAALAKAETRTRQDDAERAAWQPRLQAALGDDAALLAVAQSAPGLDIKLAAVQALVGEPTLRQAERAFRSHDRRVHRLAKQRLEAAVARRTTQARVQALTETAAALVGQTQVPVNHLVALDRDWRALDPAWIEAAQQARFSALRERIDSELREQSEQQQHGQRWLADAALALTGLRQACTQAATAGDDTSGAGLATARDAAEALRLSCPAAAPAATLNLSLASALHTAAAVQARLDLLAALVQEAQEAQEALAAAGAAPASRPSADTAAPDLATADLPAPDLPVADCPAADLPAAETPADDLQTAEASAADLPSFEPSAPVAPAAAPVPVVLGPVQRWQTLPPLDDAALAEPLALRFAQVQRTLSPALPAAAPVRRQPEARPARTPRLAPQAPSADQTAKLDGLLTQAEASAAEGQLAALQHQLQAFDTALAALPGVTLNLPAGDSLRGRYQALLDERGRLKDWQHWGGGRVREDLVAEAEALARITLAAMPVTAVANSAATAAVPAMPPEAAAAADPSAPTAPAALAVPPAAAEPTAPAEPAVTVGPAAPATDAVAPPAEAAVEVSPAAALDRAESVPPARPAVSLNLKTHGDAIQALRTRWRELDRLGAAASQTLWAAFDGALHQAYQPLAARQAAVKAARQDNLAAREALLASLEALPEQPAPGAEHEPGAAWKEQLRALDRFQAAWRPLGPVEHTVPAAARDALLQRHRRAVERIEQPLQHARRAAAAVREQLIARAEALAGAADRAPAPDAPQQVRALQAEWQQHARTLPLARAAENALWSRFKAATDAVFQQRDAAFGARDAELGANLAAREALLQRLTDLSAPAAQSGTDTDTDTDAQRPSPGGSLSAAEIERTLADVDRAWRQDVELPRGAAGPLESRYREARAAAQRQLAEAGRARWQAACDGLIARWQLCGLREGNGSSPADSAVESADLARQWAELPAWPGPCDDALARRWRAPLGALPVAQPDVDGWLLALEVALDLPASPAQQAARQQLKLLALKNALEGRSPASAAPQRSPVQSLAAALGQAGLNAGQRERLQALMAALRRAPAGALGLVLPRL